MENMETDYTELAQKLIHENIAVQKDEEVLIVIDPETDFSLAMALANEVEKAGGEYTVSIMPVRDANNATRTTAVIAKSAEACDVIISLTRHNSCAVFDTRVCDLIKKHTLRDVTLSCRDPKTFLQGCGLADYNKILEDGYKLQAVWETKKTYHFSSELGTDLRGELGEGNVMLGCGVARKRGESMAFADGEVSCTPKTGTSNGVIVIDGPIYGYRAPTVPVKLIVRNGKIVDITEGDEDIVSSLKQRMSEIENMDHLAEIAIGLNPCTLRNNDFVEEKKGYGNLHIALGDNNYFGGNVTCKVHIDCVIKQGTVEMDDMPIVRKGKVLVLGHD